MAAIATSATAALKIFANISSSTTWPAHALEMKLAHQRQHASQSKQTREVTRPSSTGNDDTIAPGDLGNRMTPRLRSVQNA
jgi:hypothetical protein